MEENKAKKPYNKKKRYYNNKNNPKKTREDRMAEKEELSEAVLGLSDRAEKPAKDTKPARYDQDAQSDGSDAAKYSRGRRYGYGKQTYNGRYKDAKEEKNQPLPELKLPEEQEEELPVSDVEELDELDSLGDIMMIDGVDGIDLIAEEHDSEAEKGSGEEDEIFYEVVGVRFGAATKTYYFDPCDMKFSVGAGVIVETVRGDKYGICSMCNTKVPASHVFLPLKKVLRAATEEDKRINEENISLANDAFKQCNIKIAEHKLDMKLIDATYTHDRSKLIFFFTAPTRVDFRELVKDLAAAFRTRIDLRQIGIRDEAKMIGGYGICGRPLCCCSFLPNFNQVSIKMAKEQNLSLNTSKISGVCGRLMCCLKFEHKTYIEESKLLPPIGSVVRTADGIGTVTEISPIAGTVKIKLNESPDSVPKFYSKNDISVLKRSNAPRDNGDDEADSYE